MGLEAATYINQLVASNPVGAADPKAQGDDHLRLIKSTLQASFPGITGAMTRTQGQLNLIGTDGTAVLPSYTFSADLDTGMYRIGANTVGISTNGVRTVSIAPSGLQVDLGQLFALDGAAGVPGYSFASDIDTGLYRIGSDVIAVTTGGASRAFWDSPGSRFVNGLQMQNMDGTLGLPGYSFSADTNTGFYRPAADDIAVVGGGVELLRINGGGLYPRFSVFPNDGTVGAPAYSFNADTNTGIYRAASDDFVIAAGGADIAHFTSNAGATPQVRPVDGVVTNPIYSFNSDPDTGLYRDTANQIAIALGGVTAGQIAQGSFNATFAGFSAGPGTVTVLWQRVGNKVTLSIPQFSGTSNSTSFSMTNLPAVIQPARSILIPHIMNQNNSVDNSDDCQVQLTAASATVTFYKAFVGIGWTAANNKGLGLSSFTGNYQQITYLLA